MTAWEVRQSNSTCEAFEQGRRCAGVCGGSGGKETGQGEFGSANQVPDAAPGRPATRAGMDTAGRAAPARLYLRQEPSAVVPHAGICPGGAG